MSRSEYSDEDDSGNNFALWRGAVKKSILGKRGQDFLRRALAALDAMPVKELYSNDLEPEPGKFCFLGAVGNESKMDLKVVQDCDRQQLSSFFNIAPAMAAEIMFENDDDFCNYSDASPEARYRRMRAWVESNIKEAK